MLTAAKLVLPALAAALFVWGAAWCVVRTACASPKTSKTQPKSTIQCVSHPQACA